MRAMVPSQNRGHEPLRHPASTFLAVSEQDDPPSPVLLDQVPDTEVARDTGSLLSVARFTSSHDAGTSTDPWS